MSVAAVLVARRSRHRTSGVPEPAAWSLRHPVVYTLLWIGGIIAVFAPLAVRRYNRIGG